MEQDNKRPNAALINREWFAAASGALDSDGLGRVLVSACRYVFGEPSGDLRNPVELAVFRMIVPALDSDIRRYIERCARNAANARKAFERVAASGGDSVPVDANTTTTSTSNTTTTSISISDEEKERVIDKEKWLTWGYFWSTGSKAVKEECTAFWSYYESLGWKNNKGAAIVSKMAAARMWRRQYETGKAPNGADAWYKALQDCPVQDYRIWDAYAGAERVDDRGIVRLRVTPAFVDQLLEYMPDLPRVLARLWRVLSVRIESMIPG